MALLEIWAESINKSHCRSCHAPIEWALLLHSKKRMPFDPPITAVSQRSVAGNLLLTVDTAKTTTHFATCPHADVWRQRRADDGRQEQDRDR